jgi:hypothetical protein
MVADELRFDYAMRDARSAHNEREGRVLLVWLKLAWHEPVLAEMDSVVRVEHEVGVIHLSLAPEQLGGFLDEAIHPHQRP